MVAKLFRVFALVPECSRAFSKLGGGRNSMVSVSFWTHPLMHMNRSTH